MKKQITNKTNNMQWDDFERIYESYLQKREFELSSQLIVKAHMINRIKFLKYSILVKSVRHCHFKHT
jgi:hypothetical protein